MAVEARSGIPARKAWFGHNALINYRYSSSSRADSGSTPFRLKPKATLFYYHRNQSGRFCIFCSGRWSGLANKKQPTGRSGGQMAQVAFATMAFFRRENWAAVAERSIAGRLFPIEIFNQA
jgi:hypothetical protein